MNNILLILLTVIAIACSSLAYVTNSKINEIEEIVKTNAELNEKLRVKIVELDVATRNVDEAHEVMNTIFLEAMDVTENYNELKKQCKKGKR